MFWSARFGRVQIRLFWTNYYNLDLSKMIWTRPKQIGPVQNNWYSTNMIWMVQNHFGPIEGQGIIYSFFIRTRLRSISRKDNNKIHCAMKLLFHLSRSSWWSGLSWRLPLASGLAIVTSRGPQPFSQIPKSQPILSK